MTNNREYALSLNLSPEETEKEVLRLDECQRKAREEDPPGFEKPQSNGVTM